MKEAETGGSVLRASSGWQRGASAGLVTVSNRIE